MILFQLSKLLEWVFSPSVLRKAVTHHHSNTVTCPFWNCDHLHTLRTRLDRSAYRIQEGYCPQYWHPQLHVLISQHTYQSCSTDWSLLAVCDNYFSPGLGQRKVPE